MENQFSMREQIIETVNKLFVYTDNRRWQKLQDEVFSESVLFDMRSVGAGEPVTLPAKQICDNWEKGFEGIDAVHHQAGNFIVTVENQEALVEAYAIALHYKQSATRGHTREFVGSYKLQLTFFPQKGWRIHAFHYYLKYTSGNVDLL